MSNTTCRCAECGDEFETLYGALMECRECGFCCDCCECDEPEWYRRMLRAQGRLAHQILAAGPPEHEDG